MADADQVNHSMDTRRVAKQQQERAITESSGLIISLAQPAIQYQVAVTRLWADTLALFVSQCEKTAEIMSSFAQQQQQQHIDKH